MDIEELIKIKPFIVHGTDIRNMLSILKDGLLAAEEIKKKKIDSKREDPLIQKANKKTRRISVWVYHNNKEVFKNDVGAFPRGKLEEEERIALIKGEHLFARHTGYDLCLVMNPEIGYKVPKTHDFCYEAFIRELGKLDKNKVVAVVANKKKVLSKIITEKRKEARKMFENIEKELEKKDIPFIQDGWKTIFKKKFQRSYKGCWVRD